MHARASTWHAAPLTLALAGHLHFKTNVQHAATARLLLLRRSRSLLLLLLLRLLLLRLLLLLLLRLQTHGGGLCGAWALPRRRRRLARLLVLLPGQHILAAGLPGDAARRGAARRRGVERVLHRVHAAPGGVWWWGGARREARGRCDAWSLLSTGGAKGQPKAHPLHPPTCPPELRGGQVLLQLEGREGGGRGGARLKLRAVGGDLAVARGLEQVHHQAGRQRAQHLGVQLPALQGGRAAWEAKWKSARGWAPGRPGGTAPAGANLPPNHRGGPWVGAHLGQHQLQLALAALLALAAAAVAAAAGLGARLAPRGRSQGALLIAGGKVGGHRSVAAVLRLCGRHCRHCRRVVARRPLHGRQLRSQQLVGCRAALRPGCRRRREAGAGALAGLRRLPARRNLSSCSRRQVACLLALLLIRRRRLTLALPDLLGRELLHKLDLRVAACRCCASLRCCCCVGICCCCCVSLRCCCCVGICCCCLCRQGRGRCHAGGLAARRGSGRLAQLLRGQLAQRALLQLVQQQLLGGAPHAGVLLLAAAPPRRRGLALERGRGAVENKHGADAVEQQPGGSR